MDKNDEIDLITKLEFLRGDIIACLAKRGVSEEALLDVMELFYDYFNIE